MQTENGRDLGTGGSDIMAAFDILLEIIEDAIAAANRTSLACMQSEDYDSARKHLITVRQLQASGTRFLL